MGARFPLTLDFSTVTRSRLCPAVVLVLCQHSSRAVIVIDGSLDPVYFAHAVAHNFRKLLHRTLAVYLIPGSSNAGKGMSACSLDTNNLVAVLG